MQSDVVQPDAAPRLVERSPRPGARRLAGLAGGRAGALIILVVLTVAFAVATPDFFTQENLLNVLRQYSVPLMLAVGQTLVIVTRGIDLSVASVAAMAGCLMTVGYSEWGLPMGVALLLGLAAGVGAGLFNGFAITRFRVPDFVATLGMLTAARGVALLLTDGVPVPSYDGGGEQRGIPSPVTTLGGDSLLGIPAIALVALGCAIVGGVLLSRTTLGRSAYAVGGNPEAAEVSGIKVNRTKMAVYGLSGLFAAIAGFMLVGRQDSANALMGDGMELQAIAAVVIGGTNLFGGEGRVSGTLIGVLVIGVLANGLTIVGVSDFWQRVVNGLIIVAVVAIDQWRRRQLEKAA
ncbi:ABC transporter permease [Patulibacter sp. SYSU D01012]|uniref:ABC transporter permease n=1 Tax=Patulibacter sp. SYSU D01012 TaxID=2817381 RepID=UPI001B30EA0C|nr:ABC transporter permease [Patulibacter sp. SYSU D01012]